MSTQQCPLCSTDEVTLINNINSNNLKYLYGKMLKAHFSNLFKIDIKYYECDECRLKFYSPPITGGENFYNYLQQFSWYYMDEKEEYEIAKKYIEQGMKVLEVGSGKGAFAKKITPKKYVGLDFSSKAKEMAAENGILIENQSIEEHACYNEGEYDVVVSFQVLEHIPDPKNFIESKMKALKAGGKLIMAVPSENSFLKYVTNFILNMPPHHVTRWSDDTFHFMAKKYGYRIVEIYHEKIQPVHKRFYLSTMIQSFFLKPVLIDLSIKRKIVSKISDLLSRILKNRLCEEMMPNGHTVVVVMEKQ
ncbi:class I SAM-dependent methyltransferase [Desulfotignum balticum]|uniref:class I SAM-dependent methyltransferase n=1 Tax=Desulfotignum balticum TaxID=115781 RepID=UPI000427DDE3|nr:class I SAM-dependent methyltransferase [Desulfotignum balticum]